MQTVRRTFAAARSFVGGFVWELFTGDNLAEKRWRRWGQIAWLVTLAAGGVVTWYLMLSGQMP